ncbi:MAG: hypothetical protein JSV91_12975 [Phycisphaerales bacterium]|nr:MAG: hypothetical protein JSV91_12975 [Phycisphaerales bacterium]
MLSSMRDLRTMTSRLGAAMAGGAAYLWPALAAAQTAPDPPTLRSTAPVWIGMLLIAALLIVVMVVSIMPSKRGHQD